jgi:copper chaperone
VKKSTIIGVQHLKAAISQHEQAIHKPENKMAAQNPERVFKVTGMSCDHCRRAVDSAIRDLHEVDEVRVDLKAGEATVIGTANDEQIAAAVKEAGYEAKRDSGP